jgi:predicted RNase H-like nuclease (RuvC/YqgF family)
MSTVQEIEAAIRALSRKDKERLAADLPAILPELGFESELKEVVAAAGSLKGEQTSEDEKTVHRVITDYRAERRRGR